MSSAPVNILVEWANDNTVINYIVNNQQDKPYYAIIKTELRTADGAIVATEDLSRSAMLTINQGNSIYHAKDVLPLSIMNFSGGYKIAVEKYGKLPAGSYQITVQLVSPQGYIPLVPPLSKFFMIPVVQLPILIKPFNKDTLKASEAQTSVIFRWTAKVPKLSEIVKYRIQVFEIYDYQNPLQALRSNQPLLDDIVKMQTQYIWRPQISFREDSAVKRFIWDIQTLDAYDNPITVENANNECRSEPFVFTVKN